MIVIVLSDCPPSLRGDLTKWLFEVSTNVFVGRVTARVRDALWERIITSCRTGRATMVYGVDNEQRFDFRVHNTEWQPVDYDGLKLMRRPLPPPAGSSRRGLGYSNASRFLKISREAGKIMNPPADERICVALVKTSGVTPSVDRLLSFDFFFCDQHGKLIQHRNWSLSLQGSEPYWIADGRGTSLSATVALEQFLTALSGKAVVCENAKRISEFIDAGCVRSSVSRPAFDLIDLQQYARKVFSDLPNYSLDTLTKALALDCNLDSVEGQGEAMAKVFSRLMSFES